MFEQDYIMRIIKEMVRAILKLLFNIDTESPSAELLKDSQCRETLNCLLDMVEKVKSGLTDLAARYGLNNISDIFMN